MRPRTILFALAGAGAGNSSRFAALLEAMDPGRFQIALAGQPQACRLAPPRVRTFCLRAVTYGRGPFTLLSIVRNNGTFPARFLENRRICARAIDEIKPDLLIVDSDIHCLAPARARRVPIVSINSSPATVELFRAIRPRPPGSSFSYHAIERVDRWLQRRYANWIVCPVIVPVEIDQASVRQVPPIVRRQFLATPDDPRINKGWDVAVMLGGSGIGTAEIDLRGFTGSMVVVGNPSDGRFPASADRVPFTSEPARYLAQARVVVIQGGFNSVSEVIALRKPAVIVPIPRHAEQLVNARAAEQLGFGRVARGDTVVSAIEDLLDAGTSVPARPMPALSCDGAAEVAAFLEEVLAV